MPASGYTAQTFTPGEVPTTAMWNYLWSNDASFNTGSGFNDGIIIARHIGAAAVVGSSISASTLIGTPVHATASGITSTTTTNVTGLTFTFTNTVTETILVIAPYWYGTNTDGTGLNINLAVGGVLMTGPYTQNDGYGPPDHRFRVYDTLVAQQSLTAGSHTITIQAASQGAGTFSVGATMFIYRYSA